MRSRWCRNTCRTWDAFKLYGSEQLQLQLETMFASCLDPRTQPLALVSMPVASILANIGQEWRNEKPLLGQAWSECCPSKTLPIGSHIVSQPIAVKRCAYDSDCVFQTSGFWVHRISFRMHSGPIDKRDDTLRLEIAAGIFMADAAVHLHACMVF